MPKHAVSLTFSDDTWRKIIARWGSEAAYKDWLKRETLNSLFPPPGTYPSTFTERI